MSTSVAKPAAAKKAVPAANANPEAAPQASERAEHIATVAYFKAEARGFEPGLEIEDWLQAEAEVDAESQR